MDLFTSSNICSAGTLEDHIRTIDFVKYVFLLIENCIVLIIDSIKGLMLLVCRNSLTNFKILNY